MTTARSSMPGLVAAVTLSLMVSSAATAVQSQPSPRSTAVDPVVPALLPMPLKHSYRLQQKYLGGDMQQSLESLGNGCFKLHRKATVLFSTITEEEGFCLLSRQPLVLRPHYYHYDGVGDRCREAFFDYANEHINSSDKGERKELPLPEGIQGQLSVFLQIGLDAMDPSWQQGQYQVVSRLRIKTYHLKRIGTERLRLPAGDFDTVRVEGSSGERERLRLWFAPELGGLWVRMERDKGRDKYVAKLKNYSRERLSEPGLTPSAAAKALSTAGGFGGFTPRCP